jgi:hypothetical protein
VVAISCSIIYCSCRLCLWISSELAHLLRVSLRVLPVLQGLLNLEVEVVEVTHVGLDLVERQLDQHTGDLWRLFVTNKLLHELVDGVSNLVLQVRVVWLDGRDELGSLLQVSLSDRHLCWVALVVHHLLLLLLHWHWLLLNHVLRHWLLLLGTAWTTLHHVVHLLAAHHAWLLLLLHLLTWVHLLLTWASWVLAEVLSWRSVVVLSWSSWSLVLGLVHLLLGSLIVLNDTEQLLEHLGQVRLRGQVVPLETTSLLSLVLLPVCLVTCLLHMKLSDLLDLIVVDHEHLTVNRMVLQVLLSLCCISWFFEADKSIGISSRSTTVTELDVFDLTKGLEKISQVVLGPAVGEVLHEQVASLLGCLVSDDLAHLFDFALSLLEGRLDNELDTWSDLAIVHFLNSLLSTQRAVLFVLLFRVVEADQSKFELFDFVVLGHREVADISERLEQISDFFISFFDWDVFHVNVVNDFSEMSSVSGLELDGLDALNGLGLECLHGGSLILEADETVASGGVVSIERDLETLDLAHWLEHLVEVFVFEFLWNFDENVVGKQLVLVATEELLIERQGTALLAVDFEVSHLLTSLGELLRIFNANHGGEEWLGEISLDLWLLIGVKDNSRFVLNGLCNLVAGDVVLWKVIKVDQLLCVHHF